MGRYNPLHLLLLTYLLLFKKNTDFYYLFTTYKYFDLLI